MFPWWLRSHAPDLLDRVSTGSCQPLALPACVSRPWLVSPVRGWATEGAGLRPYGKVTGRVFLERPSLIMPWRTGAAAILGET